MLQAGVLLGGGVVFLLPVLAHANLFSFAGLGTAALADQSEPSTYNLQTLPLPVPALNSNPMVPVQNTIAVTDGSALLAQSGPAGTAADIEEQPASSQISVYTVRDGDTLSSVANMFGVSVATILGANNIHKDTIHPGDTLLILPITGILHTIQKGDTLASLASAYKSDASDIAQYNDLSGDTLPAVGQTIIIPNGESSAPTSSAKGSTKKETTSGNTSGNPLRGAGGPALAGYFIWPVDGGMITQGLHGFNAVDIGAPKGTDIYAAAAGTVIVSEFNNAWNGGYGNYVVIEHPNGVETLYAHASNILVSQGEEVSQGQTIAQVGRTGDATGPHLHFEVRGAQNPFGDLSLGASE